MIDWNGVKMLFSAFAVFTVLMIMVAEFLFLALTHLQLYRSPKCFK